MAALPRIVRLFAGPGPNPEVVSLALASKGLDVRALTRRLKMTADGTPENRTAEFLELNPAGTTPFVELSDGSVLSESVAIVRYADALHPESPQLLGGPCARRAARVDQWAQAISIQIVQPWQRQFQYGEGRAYFRRFVPWVEESAPAVPGLRAMVEHNLSWLEARMAAREAAGGCTGFLAGTQSYSVADLQLITTADFMVKVDTAKVTPSFDGRKAFGPWLRAWADRMRIIVKELKAAT
jgi:glutathione S-transferase